MHFVCVEYECSQEIRTLICEDHRLPLTVPHWRDKIEEVLEEVFCPQA
jgi:hypothetical protein